MKKLVGSLLALVLMMSSLAGVAAQDANTAYADEVNSPATWFDDRGNQIASLEVTDVIEDWSEYEENRGPARGYLYYAVVINVTNLDSGDIEIGSRSLTLFDSMGLNISRSNATSTSDASMEAFTDNVTVSSGESIELMLVYELFNDVSPAMLIWQADRGQAVLVNLGDGTLESSAVAHGLNAPATTADDRGKPVVTMEVTGVTDDWQDYDPNREPDRGSRYVAVDFIVTNVSDAEMPVNVHNLSLIDAEGAMNGTSNTRAADGSETVIFSSQEVAPGESVEGTLVFQLFTGVDPVGLMWQPQSGMVNMVILGVGAEMDVDIEATPEGDIQATPAA